MLGELQPWFPEWPSLDRFRRDIDELFDRFFGEVAYRGSTIAWPATESFFRDGNWIMRFDLPGVEPQDIDVSVAGNTLTIRASREHRSDERNQDMHEVSYRRFERSLTLPKDVESDQIRATYQHGVLEVTMPAPPELAGRKVPIQIVTEEKKQIEHQAE